LVGFVSNAMETGLSKEILSAVIQPSPHLLVTLPIPLSRSLSLFVILLPSSLPEFGSQHSQEYWSQVVNIGAQDAGNLLVASSGEGWLLSFGEDNRPLLSLYLSLSSVSTTLPQSLLLIKYIELLLKVDISSPLSRHFISLVLTSFLLSKRSVKPSRQPHLTPLLTYRPHSAPFSFPLL
jgi:hypothetical protein